VNARQPDDQVAPARGLLRRLKRPRGLRSRLLLTVVGSVAIALAVLMLAFNLFLSSHESKDIDNAAYARADAELAALDFEGGKVVATPLPSEVPLEGQAWVYVAGRAVVSPRVGPALQRAVESFSRDAVGQQFRDVPGLHARLFVTPIVLKASGTGRVEQPVARERIAPHSGARVGEVVVAISTQSVQSMLDEVLYLSIALGVALLIAVTVLARWAMGVALRPVTRMTAAAVEWSEREPNRRFALGEPYDEITQLAATLDGLLDRIAASLRRERRFSAEISHELRTSLTRIITEGGLALRRRRKVHEYCEALSNVVVAAQVASRTVDTLVMAAQQESGLTRGRSDACAVLEEAVATCSSLASERALTMTVAPAEQPVWVGVERDVVLRILHPVLENACRYGRTQVCLNLAQTGNAVIIEVCDDGPGVQPDEAETIFVPGVRGSASGAEACSGAGLGLSLARRLARAADGDVTTVPASGGQFIVHLPKG
jgi:two-component system OmpR family sensor kinase